MILRRWAAKYREVKSTGKYKGKVVGRADLKKIRLFSSDARVLWPWAEEQLFEAFAELRKVGIPVDGPYLTVFVKSLYFVVGNSKT